MSGYPALTVRVPETGACEIDFNGTAKMAALLVGRPPAEAMDIVGQVFAICHMAQRSAASLALFGCLPVDMRDMLAAEIVREHSLRILLDWARGLGEAPNREVAMRINTLSRDEHGVRQAAALACDTILGMGSDEFLNLSADAAERWIADSDTIAARFLAASRNVRDVPFLSDTPGLLRRHGENPLVRTCAAGSLARVHMARLVDLAFHARSGDAVRAVSLGAGMGWVECSRGRLVHEADVENGMVTAYRISSPTERQFGAGGLASRWLSALSPADMGARLEAARRMVQALDPCVEFRVEAA